MDSHASLLRLAKRFSAGTLLSRLSGLVRDMAMAFCFGAAPEIAAFMAAYRLANLFRRLFGEANLQPGFVPHFEALYREDPTKAFLFYRDTAWSLLVWLLGGLAFLEGSLWAFLSLLGPDWREIVFLAMAMAPGLLFICLYALDGAFLQCRKSYFTPGVAPVLFNLTWIGAVFFARRLPLGLAARYLAFGVLLAFVIQWGWTAWRVRRHVPLSWGEWLRPHFFSPDAKKLFKPWVLGVTGVGAMQINSLLDVIFARIADPSGPAYLWFSIRLQQLPLALFGIALAGALLPPLSRAIQEGALERYHLLLQGALRSAAALMIPCTFGFFALGSRGINLLYSHGGFQSSDALQTLYCLWGYGVGLLPAAFVLLLANGFYARKTYSVPTAATLLAVVLNLALNSLMVFVLHWGAASIAFSTSLASGLNCLFLCRGSRFGRDFWKFLGKLFVSGGGAMFVVFLTRALFESHSSLLQFATEGIVFFASFFVLAYALRTREVYHPLVKSKGLD